MSFSFSIESFGKRGGGGVGGDGEEYLLMDAKSLLVANIVIPYFY